MTCKVLIADDSEVFRQFEAKILTMRGYQVLHAADGAEALRQAVAEHPDLVILDLQMPVMDGVQVLAALKRSPETKGIPVIVVTTIGREKDREILIKGGANEFLSKPIDGRVLLQRIRELTGK
jgi:CheY-like chemotaxis protein